MTSQTNDFSDRLRTIWARMAVFAELAFAVLVLGTFLLAFTARAQTVGEVPVAPTNVKSFIITLLPGIYTLLTVVLIKVLFPALTSWLTALAQKSKVAAIALKVEHFGEVVVAELDATMKPEIAQALEDGVLDENEKTKLRELALSKMKTLLGTQGLAEVSGILGIGAEAVAGYLNSVVEKKVDEKNLATAPVPA